MRTLTRSRVPQRQHRAALALRWPGGGVSPERRCSMSVMRRDELSVTRYFADVLCLRFL